MKDDNTMTEKTREYIKMPFNMTVTCKKCKMPVTIHAKPDELASDKIKEWHDKNELCEDCLRET